MTNKARKTKRVPSGWEDIADMLTHEAMVTFKTGQVLTFEQNDGKQVHLRIMRMTPYKCWVKQIDKYLTAEEANRIVSTESAKK